MKRQYVGTTLHCRRLVAYQMDEESGEPGRRLSRCLAAKVGQPLVTQFTKRLNEASWAESMTSEAPVPVIVTCQCVTEGMRMHDEFPNSGVGPGLNWAPSKESVRVVGPPPRPRLGALPQASPGCSRHARQPSSG